MQNDSSKDKIIDKYPKLKILIAGIIAATIVAVVIWRLMFPWTFFSYDMIFLGVAFTGFILGKIFKIF